MNGNEVGRYNITNAPNPVTYNTFANGALTEPTPAPANTTISIPITGIVPGQNLFAVEVHQDAVGSSDIDWGGEILATFEGSPPQLHITLGAGGSVIVSWTGGPAWKLQQSNDLSSPANWQNVAGNPTSPYVINNPAGVPRFFRLCQGCP